MKVDYKVQKPRDNLKLYKCKEMLSPKLFEIGIGYVFHFQDQSLLNQPSLDLIAFCDFSLGKGRFSLIIFVFLSFFQQEKK